ncbi:MULTISPECIES: hypothetical protein [Pseudomonas]|uniref:hypothetical protein n=1 Tax=Pseudomonas TaxID=286 RepID=UPI0018AA9163|nr:hypothetical protein [Pseudomonas guariconensis]MBF8729579.1 hypothetical protein [Pseudomonas guariconensis]
MKIQLAVGWPLPGRPSPDVETVAQQALLLAEPEKSSSHRPEKKRRQHLLAMRYWQA